MKRKFVWISIIWLSVLLILPMQVYAADAKATVEAQIDKMLARMKEPSFKEQSHDAKLLVPQGHRVRRAPLPGQLQPGAEEDYLKDGDRLQITESAMVLERLIGQFLYSKASGE